MIVVRDLTKHYRVHKRSAGIKAAIRSLFRRDYSVVRAVDGISFDVGVGERVGFLGPNGAGKTTTLKVLAGLLYPTGGTVEVGGFVPQQRRDDFLRSITLVMGQKQQLLWDLPPSETFELNRGVYDIPSDQFRQTLAELTDWLELGDLVRKPTRQLSLGERMRCELAAALLHRPSVLFLDEPTIGLDVTMQTTMRAFIKQYNEQHGATLILTSHDMDDVAALCPRIVVIDHGRLSYDGQVEGLVSQIRPEKRVVLRLAHDVDEPLLCAVGRVIERGPGRAVLQVDAQQVRKAVEMAFETLPVEDLTVESAPLEEVMSELFSRGHPSQQGSA